MPQVPAAVADFSGLTPSEESATAPLPPVLRWIYFPLHGVRQTPEGPRCACSKPACRTVGAHPAAAYGSLEESVSSALWDRYGLRTGAGLVVIDIDRKNGKDGWPYWEQLCRSYGMPPTRVVGTPSGGLHFYFQVDTHVAIPCGVNVLGQGIDVRGEKGFVVVPPTLGKDGVTPYRVLADLYPAPMPAWLLSMLLEAQRPASIRRLEAREQITLAESERAARLKSFVEDCQTWEPAIEGKGGDKTTYTLALRGTRHYALPPDLVYDALLRQYNPRCEPPWEPRDLRRKVDTAALAEAPLSTAEPAGFRDALAEIAGPVRAAAPRAGRRVRDSQHAYSFAPENLAYGKVRAASLLETASILARNPLWAGTFQWDRFPLQVTAVNPPCRLDAEKGVFSRADVSAVRCWLLANGLSVNHETARDAIVVAAHACEFDSLREYVEGLPRVAEADARDMMQQIARRGFGADRELGADLFVMRHLVGAINRALTPGWKHDHCLILSGPKGYRKTTALQALFPHTWFRAQMPSLKDRDGSHALGGFWGVNFDEMRATVREEMQVIKEYLTRTDDTYRQYGNGDVVRADRRTVFFGTTNRDASLLRDSELDRRWLIVQCTRKCDPSWIGDNRDLIWASAKTLAMVESSYLSDREVFEYLAIAQEAHRSADAWTAKVVAWLEANGSTAPLHNREEFLTRIFVDLFGGFEPEKALRNFSRHDETRIAEILHHEGWVCRVARPSPGHRAKRFWQRWDAT